MISAGVGRQPLPELPALLRRLGTSQLLRYAFAGFCVTQFPAAIYSLLVLCFSVEPLEANLSSTACGLSAGYLVHSRWRFAGGSATGEHAKIACFLITSFIAFLVNSAWVWLLVSMLCLPPLVPVPLMMFVTPWLTFLLNRHWVFRVA